MQAFDASSIIHGWDHYPPKQFPPLWKWIAGGLRRKITAFAKLRLQRSKSVRRTATSWLRAEDMTCVKMTAEAVIKAAEIKSTLEIVNEKYHPRGVGENDILIVASASVERHRLISNENRQPDIPDKKAKYKIPLVCDLPEVTVDCIDFLTLIKESGEVFGGKGK